jgi:hypothetical protein
MALPLAPVKEAHAGVLVRLNERDLDIAEKATASVEVCCRSSRSEEMGREEMRGVEGG